MSFPYTPDPLNAYMAAQTSLGAALTAVLWFRPLKPKLANVLLLAAIWTSVMLPMEADLLKGLGATLKPDHAMWYLRLSAFLATAAMLVARPRWIFVVALLGEYFLSYACEWVKEADWELAALQVAWFGVLIGLHRWRTPDAPVLATRPTLSLARPKTDLGLFLGATLLAALVANFIMHRSNGSGDEWANTFQADLFGHLKAYGTPPPCPRLHMNFWVFYYLGKSFSQYTPGWPLVMAPFQRLGIAWLANPVVLGVLAVGVARLARRAAAAGIAGVDVVTERIVSAAGILAAIMAVTGASMLLNAGSRFPHPLVCACYVWCLEGLCAIASKDAPRAKWRPAVVLGLAASIMLSARPGDGALLGLPIFIYYAYALLRRRFGLREILATAIPFGIVAALTLVILRLQLGEWFKTGYSITELFHSWAKLDFVGAKPNEVKHVVPLATGAYLWWPAAPALGVAGLFCVRRGARAIPFMLVFGALIMLRFYWSAGFSHTGATGYGPRLHLPLVVAMAVGGAILLAPMFAAARTRAWSTWSAGGKSALAVGGPAAVVAIAMVVAEARVVPLLYPPVWADMHRKTAPFRAIEKAQLKNAVVTVTGADVDFNPMDLTQNLPTDPNPDVLVLHDVGPPDIECGRKRYGNRRWYKAVGKEEVVLTPE